MRVAAFDCVNGEGQRIGITTCPVYPFVTCPTSPTLALSQHRGQWPIQKAESLTAVQESIRKHVVDGHKDGTKLDTAQRVHCRVGRVCYNSLVDVLVLVRATSAALEHSSEELGPG